MSDCLTESEIEALKEFKREVPTNQITDEEGLKFLAARKFNVQRALDLYNSHQNTRDSEDLLNIDPLEDEVRKELTSAKLTVFESERDYEGSSILLLTARLHFPNLTNRRAVLKGLVFQLDRALESLEAQRKGIVLIYDMTDSRFNNFDYELSKKILNMLKGSYPARLKKVLIVMAPLWFKAPFKVLKHFILEKLRNRVHVIHQTDLPAHLPTSSIPTHLGGTLHLDHRRWITKCLESSRNHDKPRLLPPIADRNNSGNPCLPVVMTTQKQLDSYFDGMPGDFLATVAKDEDNPEVDANSVPTSSRTSSSNRHENLDDTCLESDDEDIVNDDDDVECNMDDNVLYINLRKDGGSNGKSDETSLGSSKSRKRSASMCEMEEPIKRRPSFDYKDDPIDSTNSVTAFDLSFSDESSSDDSPVNMEHDMLHIPSGQSAMTPTQIFHYWMMVGHNGLRDEYYGLASEPPSGTVHVCKMKINRHRNRYSDIMCLDSTRVQLLTPATDGSDYINANFVDGYNSQKEYILTQGPLQKTINEFWQMVWEQAVLVIVMTTRTVERGRVKCDQYWPAETNRKKRYNKIVVENSGSFEKNECVVTTMQLQNIETSETREIKHVHFLGWPDHGTPENADSFLDFMEHIRSLQNEQAQKYSEERPGETCVVPFGVSRHPLLVHCSAGIGRTGTFVALDMLTKSLKDTGSADIMGTIRRIRGQRALSIQTPDQYLFCFEALLCYAKRIGLFSYDDDDDDDSDGIGND